VCWNVFKVARSGALTDIADLCADSDLVLLQEAVLHGSQPHPLHLSSGLEWMMAQMLGHARRGLTTGPKTGCRAPSLDSRFVRSPDVEPIVGTPKAALMTRYPMAGGVLTVVNVHAVNFVPLASFARQIAQVVALIGHETGPLLVGGDFNTWNPSRARLLMQAMTAAGLTRVPVTAPRRWRHLGQQLDHVFLRGLTLIEARPLPHIVSSDHIPLRIELTLA
jgi:endonuclease/exonuclease/phosphatase (EEP) superfamily protein YafD